MAERSFIQEVAQLLGSLMEDFQKKAIQSSDEIRFYECLAEVLRSLEKAKAPDNRLLIALERFHKSASFLIGLSSLKLDQSTYSKVACLRCLSFGKNSAPIRNLRTNPSLVKERGQS